MVVKILFAPATFLLAASILLGQSPKGALGEDREAHLKKRVVASLQASTGDTVADVGCGEGFYTIPLAQFIGASGKVFAVDIDEKALSKLKQQLTKENLKNVQVQQGLANDPGLPVESLDAAMIVNAYHEMPEHEAILKHIRAALKQDGRLVIMERITDKYEKLTRDEQVKKHHLAARFVSSELEGAGFAILKLDDPFVDLPNDAEDGKPRWWLVVARKLPQ